MGNVTLGDLEEFPLLMPRWGYVASAFCLFLIGFFGFFLNLLVILLMIKDRQLWTPLNVILFNLVCSDFSVSVLGNPLTLTSALFHRWMFSQTICVLYGFFMALLGIASITTLTVISFERYLMVTRPLRARRLSPAGAAFAVIFIWAYALALTVPPLVGWGNYVNEAANISCSVNWHEQSTNAMTYILFLFAMGQIVPFTVITFSYVNIIRTTKKNSRRLGRVSRAEARATTMVFIMIVAFTVAWTPYAIFALIEQFATESLISPGAGVIPALVAKSSICYNPLIYVGMNTQFRQSIKRIFGNNAKNKQVLAQKRLNSTLTSPIHKKTSFNDYTSKCTAEFTSPKARKREKGDSDDETSTLTSNEKSIQFMRKVELCAIQEAKTSSDVERSIDTDDEMSNEKKTFESSSFKPLSENSPILTIIDTERMVFVSKETKESEDKDILTKSYGNDAYEDHATDTIDHSADKDMSTKKIKQSYSLDLNCKTSDTKRKLSIEIEFGDFPPGVFKDTTTKFYDRGGKDTPNYKSYICDTDNDSGPDII